MRGLNISSSSAATGLTDPVAAITGVNVSEASVTSTTGTAVNLNGTGGTVSLTAVSANGAANGIVLNTTTGSFAVNGTGAAGTGGTIQNTTGDGISLNNAQGVSLSFMTVINNLGNGIRGNNVTGFTLASSTVDNNANDAATDEAGLHFTNLLGTASITTTTVSNHLEDNARILNSSGTLSQLTITNSTFRDTDTVSPGNNGLLIQGDSNANMTVDIANSSFLRNRANGLQVINNGSGTVDVEIGTAAANSGGTFQNNNVGVNIAHNGSGTLPFDVLNASFSAPTLVGAASPINLNKASAGSGTMSGTVSGNTITNANSLTGPGIRVNGNGVGGTLTTLIQSNNISQVANRGIEVIARDGSNTLNATITNNTVTLTDPLFADGIRVDAGSISSDTTTICADITGNTSTTPAGFGVRVRQRFTGTTFRLEDYAGGAADDMAVATFLSTNNNGATTSADHAGAGFGTIADCPTP